MKRRLTTQDVTWFLDLNVSEKLDLSPPYQRRSVWTRKDKIFFLDTIFRGYPCPAVFLHKITNPDTGSPTYHVVDGKQRLETIINYTLNKMSMPKDHQDENLRGKKFKELTVEYKQKLWNYVIAVDMLDIVEQSVVDEVFDRLNRNSQKLERQELRHAKYDGWFIQFAEGQTDNNVSWKDLKVTTTGRARRMKDVQFVSELMISSLHKKPQGFSQDELDFYTATYDSPEEENPDFVVDDYEADFIRRVDYLVAMEKINSCVTSHAKNFMHFYTLWNVVDNVIDTIKPEVLCVKYNDFMNTYKKIDNKDIDEKIPDENLDSHQTYARNSVGANTEFPQRQARFNALMDYIDV